MSVQPAESNSAIGGERKKGGVWDGEEKRDVGVSKRAYEFGLGV